MANLNRDNSYHSLNSQKVIIVVLVGFLGWIGLTHVAFAGADPSKDSVPTVANLNFDKVRIMLQTNPEFYKRLYERLTRTLKTAGIYRGEAENPIATLKFNLNPRPLDLASCKGDLLYDPSLELIEQVTIPRNAVTTWASTWVVLRPAHVFETIPVEKLEADMDEFLKEFIVAYQMGNSKRK